jgi:hypothetical protein
MRLGNEVEVAKGEREQAAVEREREKTGRKVAEEGLELSRTNERKLNSYVSELKTQVDVLSLELKPETLLFIPLGTGVVLCASMCGRGSLVFGLEP